MLQHIQHTCADICRQWWNPQHMNLCSHYFSEAKVHTTSYNHVNNSQSHCRITMSLYANTSTSSLHLSNHCNMNIAKVTSPCSLTVSTDHHHFLSHTSSNWKQLQYAWLCFNTIRHCCVPYHRLCASPIPQSLVNATRWLPCLHLSRLSVGPTLAVVPKATRPIDVVIEKPTPC
jgi:hypothetical protein